jgi:hypothetical protein
MRGILTAAGEQQSADGGERCKNTAPAELRFAHGEMSPFLLSRAPFGNLFPEGAAACRVFLPVAGYCSR